MKTPVGLAIVALLLGIPSVLWAAEPVPQAVRTGSYQLQLAERSKASQLVEMTRRLGWNYEQVKGSDKDCEYDLVAESFDVVVGESYKPDDGWGLLVWVSPGPDGRCPPAWKQELEKRKLIWVSPLKIGNERSMWRRVGLAVDAADNLRRDWGLDPKRIYVSGMSGGGRIASVAAVGFPDVFAGGMFICGVSHYRTLPAPGQGGKVWRPVYKAPPAKILTQARSSSRLVFLTGEQDMNRDQTKVYFADFKSLGFKHLTYLEVPEMGHTLPPLEWLAKGLDGLEIPAAASPPKR